MSERGLYRSRAGTERGRPPPFGCCVAHRLGEPHTTWQLRPDPGQRRPGVELAGMRTWVPRQGSPGLLGPVHVIRGRKKGVGVRVRARGRQGNTGRTSACPDF